MFCTYCGAKIEDTAQVCSNCGAATHVEQPAAAPVPPVPPVTYVAPVVSAPAPSLPAENRPLGAWTYFWLQVLFAVPVVGFVFLIVFSCSDANINRRNFARSHWCALLVGVIILAIFLVAAFVLGVSLESLS